MFDITEDLEGIDESTMRDMVAELRMGWQMETVNAEINQKRAMQKAHVKNESRAIEGVGRLRMRIDPSSFHYWGQRLGYSCWDDEQFKTEYERDNPASKVICGGTKTMVGSRKKFSKTYNL